MKRVDLLKARNNLKKEIDALDEYRWTKTNLGKEESTKINTEISNKKKQYMFYNNMLKARNNG